MKITHLVNQYVLISFAIAIILLRSGISAAELVEPTRTLDGTEKQVGQLSVFSEPPEMPVTIDGEKVGVTPLINFSFEHGTHVVTIDKDKAEIYVTTGKSTRITYFKGRFLEIAEKAADPALPTHPSPEPKKTPIAQQVKHSDKPPSSFYWPINPTGPIY